MRILSTTLIVLVISLSLSQVFAVITPQDIDLYNPTTPNRGFSVVLDPNYPNMKAHEVGDLNNDGFPDMIIASLATPSPSGDGKGCAYVVFGTQRGLPSKVDLAAWNGTHGIRIFGAASELGDIIYRNMGSAGDLNHDGIDDLFISVENSEGPGAVYIIFGKTTLHADINLADLAAGDGIKIVGTNNDENFGYVVSKAGDLNRDDCDDLLIGTVAVPTFGVVYVIYGKPGLNHDMYAGSLAADEGVTFYGDPSTFAESDELVEDQASVEDAVSLDDTATYVVKANSKAKKDSNSSFVRFALWMLYSIQSVVFPEI